MSGDLQEVKQRQAIYTSQSSSTPYSSLTILFLAFMAHTGCTGMDRRCDCLARNFGRELPSKRESLNH